MFGRVNQQPSPQTINSPIFEQPLPSKLSLLPSLSQYFINVPHNAIYSLCNKLSPIQNTTLSIFNLLQHQLLDYFITKMNNGNTYNFIVLEIVNYLNSINYGLSIKFANYLMREQVKLKICQNRQYINGQLNNNNAVVLHSNKNTIHQNTKNIFPIDNKKINPPSISLLQNINTPTTINPIHKKHTNINTLPYQNLITISKNQDSVLLADKYMNDKSQTQNLINKINGNRQLREMGIFNNIKCLVCQKLVIINQDKSMFKCRDCGEIFHRKCMPRENNCFFCQLENINPLQKVKTQLFIGFLRKGTKKHFLSFELTKTQIDNQLSKNRSNNKYTPSHLLPSIQIQLRSIRIKDYSDPVSNFINLFPDACSIMINNRLIKQFQPLHKQSSLKYRRDQCIKLSSYVNIGINKIVITQRILKKDIKSDERVQPENHLISIYLVENLEVPQLSNKISSFTNNNKINESSAVQKFLSNLQSRISEFDDSENLLKQSMLIGQTSKFLSQTKEQQEEVVCDSIKVPLVCSLSLQKMKYPGRTIFCKHFTCFDVYNFILLNSQAKLPKWQCPICKASAYHFKIDCIINSIISQIDKLTQTKNPISSTQIKQIEQVKEIEFDKYLNIKLRNLDGKILKNQKLAKENNENCVYTEFVPNWIDNIYDLPIEGKCKRGWENQQIQNSKKKYVENSTQFTNFWKKINQSHLEKMPYKMNNQQLLQINTNIINKNDQLSVSSITINEQTKQSKTEITDTLPQVKTIINQNEESSLKEQKQPEMVVLEIIMQNNKQEQKQLIDNSDKKQQTWKTSQEIENKYNPISEVNQMEDFKNSIPNQKIKQQNKYHLINEQNQILKPTLESLGNDKDNQQRKIVLPSQFQKYNDVTTTAGSEMGRRITQSQEKFLKLKKILKAGVDLPILVNNRNMSPPQNKSKGKLNINDESSPLREHEIQQLHDKAQQKKRYTQYIIKDKTKQNIVSQYAKLDCNLFNNNIFFRKDNVNKLEKKMEIDPYNGVSTRGKSKMKDINNTEKIKDSNLEMALNADVIQLSD